MIKAFIFDLDGVITDTAEYHYLAWKNLAESMGWNFDREINEQLRGISRLDSIQLILDHNNISAEDKQIQDWAKQKNSYYVDSLDAMSPADYLPGAHELLIDLKEAGFIISLGSASKNARLVLEKLNAMEYFDLIGDGHSVNKSKPAPDIFLYSSSQLGLTPSECIVYEDAQSGVQAAKTGGFYCVGIGPEERVGEADIFYKEMQFATLENVRNSLNHLF